MNKAERRENYVDYLSITRIRDIPISGWFAIAKHVIRQLGQDNIAVISAGIAFFFFLSVFPAISAGVALYSIALEPSAIQEQLSILQSLIPAEAYSMVENIVLVQINRPSEALSIQLVITTLFAIWSAKKGTNAVFKGINVAYDIEENRGFIKNALLTAGFTAAGVLLLLIAVFMLALFPVFIGWLGLSLSEAIMASIARWCMLIVVVLVSLAIVYRVAPARNIPKFRWVTPGSLFACVLWLLGSLLFTIYTDQLGNFDKTYGSFTAVAVLMLWFYLSGIVLLIGAEINSEVERLVKSNYQNGLYDPSKDRG